MISANSTKTLAIKFDVNSTSGSAGTQTITVDHSQITAIDSNSNLLGSTLTGTATGNTQTLQSTGVVVNLVSASATATPSTTGVSGYATGTFVFTVKANGINLAKLSTSGNIVATGTVNGAGSLTNVAYSVTPDQIVSDGSQVTVTLTTTRTSTTAQNVKFALTDLKFMETTPTAGLTDVNSGFDNFYTNTVYSN